MTFIVSSVVSAIGSNKAANTQANAASRGQDIAQKEFQTITGQEQPYMQSGYGAVNELDYLLGIPGGGYGPQPSGQQGYLSGVGSPSMQPNGYPTGWNGISAFKGGYPTAKGAGGPVPQGKPGQQGSAAGGFGSLVTPFTAQNWQQLSPMYNFDVQQGRQGVLNQDTMGQGALSGAAAKDLINYNQGAANQSFGQAFNQYQTQQGNIFNRLSNIATLGQAAASNTGVAGTALAGTAAQAAVASGSYQAAGQQAVAGDISNAIIGGSQSLPWLTAGGGGYQGINTGSYNPNNPTAGPAFNQGNTGDYCDYLLKDHIEPYLFNGQANLMLYKFEYKDSPGILQYGYIAQEAKEQYPQAISRGPKGYLKVDYSKIPGPSWEELQEIGRTLNA